MSSLLQPTSHDEHNANHVHQRQRQIQTQTKALRHLLIIPAVERKHLRLRITIIYPIYPLDMPLVSQRPTSTSDFLASLMHIMVLHTAYIMLGRIHSCHVEPILSGGDLMYIALFWSCIRIYSLHLRWHGHYDVGFSFYSKVGNAYHERLSPILHSMS